jgi:hypothetical protein
VLLLLLSLAACAGPRAVREPLVVNTRVLGGELHVAGLQVGPDAEAWFDRDLTVESEGDILILGVLRGMPGDAAREDSRGADLVLRSRTRIVIAGAVLGGPGRDGSLHPAALAALGEDPRCTRLSSEEALEALRDLLGRQPEAITDVSLLAGGRGGNVVLDAPAIFIERVVAGAAGRGGPGGDGGDGGMLYMPCGFAFRDGSPGTFGGEAGAGGPAVRGFHGSVGGNGGNGGGGGGWPPPVARR